MVSAKSVSQYRALPKSKETAAAKSTATFFLFGAEYMGVVPLAIVVCLFCAKVAVGADFRGTGSDLMWTLVLSEMERVVGGREGAFRATYDRVLERTAGNAGAAETVKAFFGFQYRNLLSAVVANNKHVGGDGPPTADPSEISNFALKLPPISRFEPLGEDERFGAFSEECGALADLYRATDGPHWLVQRGWNDAAQLRNNCCAAFGVTCNRDGHVEQLTLTGNNLCGSIPPSIGVLQSLTRLSVGPLLLRRSCHAIHENPLTYSMEWHRSFVSNAISEVAAEIGQLSRLSYLWGLFCGPFLMRILCLMSVVDVVISMPQSSVVQQDPVYSPADRKPFESPKPVCSLVLASRLSATIFPPNHSMFWCREQILRRQRH